MTDVSVIPVHLLSSLFCTSGLLPPSFRSLRVQLSEKPGVQVALRFGGERSMSWALNLLVKFFSFHHEQFLQPLEEGREALVGFSRSGPFLSFL